MQSDELDGRKVCVISTKPGARRVRGGAPHHTYIQKYRQGSTRDRGKGARGKSSLESFFKGMSSEQS